MTEKKVSEKQTLVQQNANKVAARVKTIEEMLVGTEAGAIWNEIKEKTIQMFALPDQRILDHAAPTPVEPTKLYLLTRSTSVLPAIESAVGGNYTVELADRFVVVARAVTPLTRK